MIEGFIGTYTTKKSKGIYKFILDENNGKIINSELFINISSPKYIFLDEDYLYTVCKINNGGAVNVYDFSGALIDSLVYEENESCHITKINNYLYTSNFHTGQVSKLEFKNNKLKLIKTKDFKKNAGCHQVIQDNKNLYVFCLNLDKIFVLDFDLNIKNEISFPINTGIRHGVFSKDKKTLYATAELSQEVFTIRIEDFKIINSANIVKYSKENSASAIRLNKDKNLLFTATRGDNSISLFDVSTKALKPLQTIKSGGEHPRDFILYKDKFILVVNRDSDNLCVFKLEDKKIGDKVCEINVPEAVSVILKGE